MADRPRAMETVIVQRWRGRDVDPHIAGTEETRFFIDFNSVADCKVTFEPVQFEDFRATSILDNQRAGIRVTSENCGIQAHVRHHLQPMACDFAELRKIGNRGRLRMNETSGENQRKR